MVYIKFRQGDPKRFQVLRGQFSVGIGSRHLSQLFRSEDGAAADPYLSNERAQRQGCAFLWRRRRGRRQDRARRRCRADLSREGWGLGRERRRYLDRRNLRQNRLGEQAIQANEPPKEKSR